MSVRIIYKNCTNCKSCYNECPADVFGWDKQKNIPYIAYPDECNHCGICAAECKFNAINLTLPPGAWSDLNKRYFSRLTTPPEVKWTYKW